MASHAQSHTHQTAAPGVSLLERLLCPACRLVHAALFRKFEIPAEYSAGRHGLLSHSGFDGSRELQLRWIGTAGHELRTGKTTILIDPFVSRPPLERMLTGAKLAASSEDIARYFPRADYILTGHSHYDHLMDVPEIARQTGAAVVGSASTCRVARAGGVPADRTIEVDREKGADLTLGDFRVQFIPSRHGEFFFGRVPSDGEIRSVGGDGLLRSYEYRMGGAFGIRL